MPDYHTSHQHVPLNFLLNREKRVMLKKLPNLPLLHVMSYVFYNLCIQPVAYLINYNEASFMFNVLYLLHKLICEMHCLTRKINIPCNEGCKAISAVSSVLSSILSNIIIQSQKHQTCYSF